MLKLLLILEFLLLSVTLSSQTGWVQSISKDGKATHKECIHLKVDAESVLFVVSGTSYQGFQKVGVDSEGQPIWIDSASGKIVHRVVQKDGLIVFHKSDKKAYYYRPGK